MSSNIDRGGPDEFVFHSRSTYMDENQRLNDALRDCRQLRMAVTEAEEGWRDALSVAKNIQQQLHQKEEEVKSLRTLLSLTPNAKNDRSKSSPTHTNWEDNRAELAAERDGLRQAVNHFKDQLQAALEEIDDLKSVSQLSPLELEAMKRELEMRTRHQRISAQFLRSTASAVVERVDNATTSYAELASGIAELVDVVSNLSNCELGGLAVFIGQELQMPESQGRDTLGFDEANDAEQLPEEVHKQTLRQQIERLGFINRRANRLNQWVGAVTKFFAQEQQLYHYNPRLQQLQQMARSPSLHADWHGLREQEGGHIFVQSTPTSPSPSTISRYPSSLNLIDSRPAQAPQRPFETANPQPRYAKPTSAPTSATSKQPSTNPSDGVLHATSPPRLRRGNSFTALSNASSVLLKPQMLTNVPRDARDGDEETSAFQRHTTQEQITTSTERPQATEQEENVRHKEECSSHSKLTQRQASDSTTDRKVQYRYTELKSPPKSRTPGHSASTSPRAKNSSNVSPKKTRRQHQPPTPEDIQQIITDKLHKAMADILHSHDHKEDMMKTKEALEELVPYVQDEISDHPEPATADDERSIVESSPCSELEFAAKKPLSKLKVKTRRKKVGTKSKRKQREPRYATSTAATTRRRRLVREASSPTLVNDHQSTPEVNHPKRFDSYVSRLFTSS